MPENANEKWLERHLAEQTLTPEQIEFLNEWRSGPPIDETNAEEILHFVFGYAKVFYGLTPDEVERRLEDPSLGHDLAYQEAALRRLARYPRQAYQYMAEKIAALSKRNSEIAKRERPTRQDAWSALIGDCLDDHPNANAAEVFGYLAGDPSVQVEGDELRLVSGAGNRLDREKIRNRLRIIRKRISLGT